MLDKEQISRIVAAFVERTKPYYIDGSVKQYGNRRAYGGRAATPYPEYWQGYNKAVKQRDGLRVHIESGVFPEHLIHSRSPNQTQVEFDYIRANFKQVTVPSYVDFENMMVGALHQSNWTYDWGAAAGEVEDETSFQRYITDRIDHFGSLSDWMKHILPKIKTLDPMGVVCVMPKRVPTIEGTDEQGEVALLIDPDTLVDPQPIYFSVDTVVGKEDDRWYLLMTQEKSVVTRGNEEVREGMVMWLVDDVNCWRVYQTGKRHDLTFAWELHFAHDCGFIPCEPLKGRPVIEDGTVMYESYYLPAKDLFDLVLLDSMNLFMIKSNSVYPMRVMLGHECEYSDIASGSSCVGGTLHRSSEDGIVAAGKCPSCNGTGVAARLGPAGVLFVKERADRETGQQVKVQDAMTFVEPTATTPTILRQEIRDNTAEGRRMLHLHSDTPMVGAEAETATQVGVGVKARANFIAPIASQIFGTIEFVSRSIAKQRYGSWEEYFSIIPATQYDLRTEADYLALLGEAVQKGLPPAAIEEVLRGYFNIRYASDPYMQEAMKVIVQADRLVTANWQQIAAMQGKGEVKGWEVALHQQALGIYDRLMEEQGFAQLDAFAKADRMRAYAEQTFGTTAAPATNNVVPAVRPAAQLVQDTEVMRVVKEPQQEEAPSALNGAQVQSLVQIINQVSLGIISQQTAEPLIEAAFPGIDPADVQAMLAGVKSISPAKAEVL